MGQKGVGSQPCQQDTNADTEANGPFGLAIDSETILIYGEGCFN